MKEQRMGFIEAKYDHKLGRQYNIDSDIDYNSDNDIKANKRTSVVSNVAQTDVESVYKSNYALQLSEERVTIFNKTFFPSRFSVASEAEAEAEAKETQNTTR